MAFSTDLVLAEDGKSYTYYGMRLVPIGAVDELLQFNGAVAFQLSGDTVTAMGWVAGIDLVDLVRQFPSSADTLARAIVHSVDGPHLHVAVKRGSGSFWAESGFGAFGTSDNAKFSNSNFPYAVAGATHRLFAVKTQLANGAGFSGVNVNNLIPDAAWVGTSDCRAIGTPQIMPPASAIRGVGSVRVCGGFTWRQRMKQFFDAVVAGTESDIRSDVVDCVVHATRRAVTYLENHSIDLDKTLDVFVPVYILRDGQVRRILPVTAQQVYDHAILGPVWSLPRVGGLCRTLGQGCRQMTYYPFTNDVDSSTSNDLGQYNALKNAGCTVAQLTGHIAASPLWKSLDGVPIVALTGGLSAAFGPGNLPASGDELSSDAVWAEYFNSIIVTEGDTVPKRATDGATAQLQTDEVYLPILQAELAAKVDAGLFTIRPTSWDAGRIGLGALVAVCTGALVPKKTKVYEMLPYVEAIELRSLPSGVVPAPYGNALLFADDQAGCITDIS